MSIRIESVTKKFGSRLLFDGLNLKIPLGKTTILAGPSGCGKTTLLRMISGLDKDYTGKITGAPQSVSFMFQEDRLIPWKTVRGNIDFVLCDTMDNNKIEKTVGSMIRDVQLDGDEYKLPSELSGGMKRRVAMARAYCYPAELYLFDEPFKGFDAKLQQDMLLLYERLFIKSGKTAILVTHDETIINGLGQNIIDISSFCSKIK